MSNLNLYGDSPEVVAYALLCCIANKEGRLSGKALITADKNWIFENYDDCLRVAKGGFQPLKPK